MRMKKYITALGGGTLVNLSSDLYFLNSWPEIQTICIPWTLARLLPVRGFLGFPPAHALTWKFRDIREEGLRILQSLSLFCRVVAMDYKRLHNTSSVDLLPDIYGKPNKRRRQKETSNIYEVEKLVAKRCVSGVSFWGFCMLIFCVVYFRLKYKFLLFNKQTYLIQHFLPRLIST
jgi:hypothetical protein